MKKEKYSSTVMEYIFLLKETI